MDAARLQPALDRMTEKVADDDLLGYLGAMSRFMLLEVPDCVGLSITVVVDGDPYTVLATDPQVRAVDASQYLTDGPCLTSIDQAEPIEATDLLDEQRWHTYAQASAAAGIRSSLSLPLRYDGDIIGAFNLYGGTPHAFDDRAHLLAELVSGHAALAIRNADLSLGTAALATAPSGPPDDRRTVDRVAELIADLKRQTPGQARDQLQDVAEQAGLELPQLAELLLRLLGPDA
jgi:GAF domain-containing protein